MATRRRRPSKAEDVLELIGRHLDAGAYLDTRHAFERRTERRITLPEVLQVLRGGYHEKRKDELKREHNAWSYAIRGKTVDRRELRVCVSFDETGFLLIITAIALEGKPGRQS